MQRIKTLKSKFGQITIFTNEPKDILYIQPEGYVSPSFAKKDMAFVIEFEKSHQIEWTYVVDTSKVIMANPLNVFYLTKLKKLKRMKEYVVYAPSSMVRIMLFLARWISQPDRVIKTEAALRKVLNKGPRNENDT